MDIATILLTAGTAIGGGGTVFLWLEAKSERVRKKRNTDVDGRIAAALSPLNTSIQALTHKLDSRKEQVAGEIKVALSEALEPVRDQLSILNTKVEPLWTALMSVGINNIGVLHQPDPRRAEIDTLLEEARAELRGGPVMPMDRYLKLRHFLTLIRDWEPGQDVGFPVLPAEPTSAAIVLPIMVLSRTRRRQEQAQEQRQK